jgi:hypothetical protein
MNKLLRACLLLPIACLLLKWPTLPAQVPLHFSRNGADAYGDKHWLWGMVFMPLLIYVTLPLVYRTKANPEAYRPLGIGVALFLSLVLCVLLVAGIPTV